MFLPYLGEIFFKFYDLGHFSTANRMGYSKISKMISFELYLTEVFRENFVRFFLGHPLYQFFANGNHRVKRKLKVYRIMGLHCKPKKIKKM